jgi:hypothetical protein
MKPIIRFLTLLILLSAPHLASAYYDPGVQRWINRDPVVDLGVVRLCTPPTAARLAGRALDLYSFVRNRPLESRDGFGLWEQGIEDAEYQLKVGECLGIAQKRLDEYRELLRRGELHTDSDKWFHCVVSCEMTRTCGSAIAERIANIHERLHPGAEEDTWLDQVANQKGRSIGSDCKDKRSCEQACEDSGYRK